MLSYGRESIIVSIGQFRKEKNHMMQLEAFDQFLQQFPEKVYEGGKEVLSKDDIGLVMIGSLRKHKKSDARRVDKLKERVKDLGLEVQPFERVHLTAVVQSINYCGCP